MNHHSEIGRSRPDFAQQRARVEELLARYPAVTVPEAQEILLFIKKGPLVDVGMLTSDDALKARLAQFRADHKQEFALGWRQLLALGALVLGFVLLCYFLWDFGTVR